MNKILIIDDIESYCKQLKAFLEQENYRAEYRVTAEEGQELALKENWNLILLDVALDNNNNGVDILKKLLQKQINCPVIMVSGESTIETAVEATRLGAYDFLVKPVDQERLKLTIKNALEINSLSQFTESLYRELQENLKIVGNSTQIQKLIRDINIISQSDIKVLISGETGVGKDLVARAIHLYSERSKKPFKAINCAAIPDTLIESELFGYEKGAFTGADKSKDGLFSVVDGGTLFLDEIADLSLNAQASVLRVINSGEFEKLGGTRTYQVDTRIISATNKNLTMEIKKGNFREDLYYRLNMAQIHVPPLRERKEDISVLAQYFLKDFCRMYNKNITNFSTEAMQLLENQNWPGNVRQLRSLIEKIVTIETKNFISFQSTLNALVIDEKMIKILNMEDYDQAVKEFEKLYLFKQMNVARGDMAEAARRMNLENDELARLLDLFEIKYN